MKIQTNIRAGASKQKRGSSTDSVDVVEPVVVYTPPVYRCVGI